ncbi:DUF1217 domain-containing protein [Lentibacter algarum]|uniref:DUF1217 domain-containing protein n=1 Tax=Lentibacter algarum TaxID=576131 RepID=UPI001C07840D|nr:DUF1217 domain-containing protein [Lentibacter algarum]MBU2981208.1 DUF1217 domain-containing protein [Lentibacter algarum]
MTFQPVVPTGGLAGWRFLQATLERQSEAFENSNEVKSDAAYFAENIGEATSAEALVSDRRLLSVALTAFGLQDDLDNKYFIRKVLEEGTDADDALANRLSDTRYREFSDAFGFGSIPRIRFPGFAEDVIDKFEDRSFEVAVGEQNESFRFGLNLERELPGIAADDTSTDAKWYTVMGNAALRSVFETAFGLPSQFGQIDLEQQLEVFKDYAERRFGSSEVDQFTDPEKLDELVQLYFVQEQLSQGQTASGSSVALTLLQSSQSFWQ